MSESDTKVECGEHGSASATFVCQHLADGNDLGFHVGYDPENPLDLYPDAWCDACEKVRVAGNGWNDRSEAFASIKLLCCWCYGRVRENNWVQDDEAYEALVSASVALLQDRQDSLIERFRLNDHDRWDWDQKAGNLVFSHEGQPQVEAEVHFSGTISTSSKTWRWAWANEHLEDNVRRRSSEVRLFGRKAGFLRLSAAQWDATEVDGWEMTAIMAKLLGAIGAYRTADDDRFVYMIITRAKWVRKKRMSWLFG